MCIFKNDLKTRFIQDLCWSWSNNYKNKSSNLKWCFWLVLQLLPFLINSWINTVILHQQQPWTCNLRQIMKRYEDMATSEMYIPSSFTDIGITQRSPRARAPPEGRVLHINGGNHFFFRILKGQGLTGARPVFVDPTCRHKNISALCFADTLAIFGQKWKRFIINLQT